MLNKIEAYFAKVIKERAGFLLILAWFLLIPQLFSWRFFFLFLMITLVLLPRDIHNGRIKIMMSLPFSRSDIFWSSYIFLVTFAVITRMIAGALFNTPLNALGWNIIGTLIFSSAYFGVAMISVTLGFGNFVIPFLVLIADSFLGSIGKNWKFTYNFLGSPSGFNPYSMISPIYQGNQIAALIFAVALLMTAYILFERRGMSR